MTRYCVRFIPEGVSKASSGALFIAESPSVGDFYEALLQENPGACILYKTLNSKSYA